MCDQCVAIYLRLCFSQLHLSYCVCHMVTVVNKTSSTQKWKNNFNNNLLKEAAAEIGRYSLYGTYTYFVIHNNTAPGSLIMPQALLTLRPGVMDLEWDTRRRPDQFTATFKPRLSPKQSLPPLLQDFPHRGLRALKHSCYYPQLAWPVGFHETWDCGERSVVFIQ